MRRTQICLRNLSPLAIGYRAAYQGHFMESLGHIPGRTWRGAVAMSILRSYRCSGPTSGCSTQSCPLWHDHECWFLPFFQGSHAAIFTNLYPGDMNSVFCGPTPLTTECCDVFPGSRSAYLAATREAKGAERYRLLSSPEPHGSYDMLLSRLRREQCDKCAVCQSDLKPQESPYVELVTDQVGTYLRFPRVRMARQAHVAINRRRQTAEDQHLYSVTAIDEQQSFNAYVGHLITSEDEANVPYPVDVVENILDFLEQRNVSQPLLVGGGVSRGLGQVVVASLRQKHVSLGSLQERQRAFQEAVGDEDGFLFSLTLCSEALSGTTSVGLQGELVMARLEELTGVAFFLTTRAQYHKPTVVSGWDLQNSAPAEHMAATKAGSVAVFGAAVNAESKPVLLDGLAKLENAGLGVRREQGYGQVVVCHPLHCAGVRM